MWSKISKYEAAMEEYDVPRLYASISTTYHSFHRIGCSLFINFLCNKYISNVFVTPSVYPVLLFFLFASYTSIEEQLHKPRQYIKVNKWFKILYEGYSIKNIPNSFVCVFGGGGGGYLRYLLLLYLFRKFL